MTSIACTQVIVDENPDVKSGFTVKMQFAENPFFSNRVLEKKVDYHEDGTVKLSVVPPQWFPGKVHLPLQCSPRHSLCQDDIMQEACQSSAQ